MLWLRRHEEGKGKKNEEKGKGEEGRGREGREKDSLILELALHKDKMHVLCPFHLERLLTFVLRYSKSLKKTCNSKPSTNSLSY